MSEARFGIQGVQNGYVVSWVRPAEETIVGQWWWKKTVTVEPAWVHLGTLYETLALAEAAVRRLAMPPLVFDGDGEPIIPDQPPSEAKA